jgi:diphthamide biosynthesis methyltransferase
MENGVVFHFFCLMICLTKLPLYFSTNTKHILHTLCYVNILLRRFILREREATEKLLVVVHQKEEKKSKVCPPSSCLLLAYGKSLTSCIEYYL